MITKSLLVELEKWKSRVVSAKENINYTIAEIKRIETEYDESKKQYENEIRRLAHEQNCLDQRQFLLDSQLQEYELKLKVFTEEQTEKETSLKDNTFELGKIKEEMNHLDKSHEKKMQKVMNELENAKDKLKQLQQLEKDLEKKFCNTIKSRKDETEEKLNKMEKMFEERISKLEYKYKIKMDPVLFNIESLNADLSFAEADLEEKLKDIQNLKKENRTLEKKYEDAVDARKERTRGKSKQTTTSPSKANFNFATDFGSYDLAFA